MPVESTRLELLTALARKVLWLSSWTIHHANHIRPNSDGLKVGGHQASSASLVTIMSALYFSVLRPEDRVAVITFMDGIVSPTLMAIAIRSLFRDWRAT